MQRKSSVGLTPRITRTFVLYGLGLVLVFSGIGFASGWSTFMRGAQRELTAQGNKTAAELDVWHASVLDSTAEILQRPRLYASILDDLFGDRLTESERIQLGAERTIDLHAALGTWIGSGPGFTEIDLVDVESGQVRLSTDPENMDPARSNMAFLSSSVTSPVVLRSYDETTGDFSMHSVVPVRTPDDRIVGLLVATFPPHSFQRIIADFDHGSGANAYALDQEGRILAPLSGMAGAASTDGSAQGAVVDACIRDHAGIITAPNAAGEVVMSSVAWLDGMDGCLVIEIERAAVLAPLWAMLRIFGLVGLVFLPFSLALGIYLARQVARPVKELEAGVRAMAEGDLDHLIPEHGAGEVGSRTPVSQPITAHRDASDRVGAVSTDEGDSGQPGVFEQEMKTAQQGLEERVRARTHDLALSEERFRRAILDAPFPIMLHAEDGEVLLISRTWTRLSGYTHQDIPNTDAWVIKAYGEGKDAESEGIAELYQLTEPIDEGEFDVMTAFGTIQTWAFQSLPLGRMVDGRASVITMAMDVTDRKRAEMALLENEERRRHVVSELERSNQELEQFAYVASHDLQEPLRKVSVFGDRLARRYGDVLEETGLDYLARMQDATSRMQTLIDDLLLFSRVTTQASPFTPAPLQPIVDAVLRDLEVRIKESGAQITVADLPVLLADKSQIRQLFQNLLGNALKFHRPDVVPVIKVSAGPAQDGMVQCQIADNGIGLDPQFAESIFAPFQRLHSRTEYPGSGIGLAICRKIVERHGGEIWVESRPDQGAKFLFTLPVVDEA